MRLYDENIAELNRLLEGRKAGRKKIGGTLSDWQDVGEQNLILKQEMAYELGGGGREALGALAVTADDRLVGADEIAVYGPDLPEIKGDTDYARIALVRVREDGLGEGNALYRAIRKIEYTRYHLNPRGYMMRISTSSRREQVRVGRDALREGLDFAKVGKMFLDSYHENPNIEAVRLIFITDADFPYRDLAKWVEKTERITGAIDHIFKNVTMDCSVCNLKEICDEVEGMRELHFGA